MSMLSEKDPRENFIKPCTFKEMAVMYKVTYKTMLAWIKPFRSEIGEIHGRCLTIPQVKMVFSKLDFPPAFYVSGSESK